MFLVMLHLNNVYTVHNLLPSKRLSGALYVIHVLQLNHCVTYPSNVSIFAPSFPCQ